MKNKFKLHAPIISIVLSLLAVGYTFANQVVVVPLGADETPSGMVAMFKTENCPSGWEKYLAAHDRFFYGTINEAAVGQTAGSNSHSHRWAEWNYANSKKWTSFDSTGHFASMMDWGDGIDNAGVGIYPLATNASDVDSRVRYYTNLGSSLPSYIRLLPCAKT